MFRVSKKFIPIFVLAAVVIVVASTSLYLFHQSRLHQEQAGLVAIVQSQARLIESVARFDSLHNQHDLPEGARAATLSQILESKIYHDGWGKSGEFTLAEESSGAIKFLNHLRFQDNTKPPLEVTMGSPNAKPMQLALQSKSGMLIGLDYRGEKVLAAYEWLDVLEVGLVAKIDLSEVHASFLEEATLFSLIAVFLMLVGSFVYYALTRIVYRSLEESEEQMQLLLESSGEAIFGIDTEMLCTFANPMCLKLTGYGSVKELLGRNMHALIHHHHADGSEYPTEKCRIGEALHIGVGVHADDEVFWHKDGNYFPVKYSSYPIRQQGEVVGAVVNFNDISERKQAEQALRQSEEKWRSLTTNSPDHIMMIDRQGLVQFINHTVPDLSPEQVIGKPINNYVPEAFHEDANACFERVWHTGEPDSYETKYHDAEGEIHCFEANVGPVMKSDEIVSLIISARDITVHNQAEAALRVSQDRYKEAQHLAHVGNWQLNLIDNYLYWSDEIYHIFEIDKTNFAASYDAFINAIHPDDREAVNTAYAQSLEDKSPYEITHRLMMADGRVKYVQERCETVYDNSGQAIKSSGTVQDITERIKAEDQLRKSEALLKEAQAIGHLGSWDWDVVNDVTHWSDGLCNIFGVGKNVFNFEFFLQYVHPDDRDSLLAQMDAEMKGGESTKYVYRIIRPDGEIRSVYTLTKIHFDQQQKTIRMIGVTQDVTEQKAVEDELAKYRYHLEELVALRTKELEGMNKELESFSYSVSHDLRAPLRAIDGFSQALLDDYQDILDETGKNYLQRVSSSVHRMGDLIDDILALSRLTRYELNQTSVDLCALAESCIVELKAGDPERTVEINIMPDIMAYGDKNMLRVVLSNLLGNAWKYSSKQEDAKIEFGLELRDGEKVYYVRDNGVGFDMAYADKLFGVFQRLHGRDEFEGTGIGLATVQRVIHRHGGRVWAEAEVGQGASFFFVLPEAQE